MMMTRDFREFQPLFDDMYMVRGCAAKGFDFYELFARRPMFTIDILTRQPPNFGDYHETCEFILNWLEEACIGGAYFLTAKDVVYNSKKVEWVGFAFESEADAVVFSSYLNNIEGIIYETTLRQARVTETERQFTEVMTLTGMFDFVEGHGPIPV